MFIRGFRMRLSILAATAFAAGVAALPACAATVVIDDFNRANTASGANGLGPNWTMLKNGALITNGQAIGGTQSLYKYVGPGSYAANEVGFDFSTADSPTQGTYYDGALLDWNGTAGYFLKVQHQGAPAGFNKYSIGYVTLNAITGLYTYTNGIFGDIGATLTSGHLDASVVNNVGTLTLTSGASTYSFNYTYGAAQTYSGNTIGLGIGDAAHLDNFGARAAAAVPEPATWGLMLVGFGMMGSAMRHGRRRLQPVRA
jgi:hypothetical protein